MELNRHNEALKYYKKSQKNNYKDQYSVLYRIGETNEKLGDLVKAIDAYKKALRLKPDNKELKLKIKSLEDIKYDKSQYYIRKKLFYYND